MDQEIVDLPWHHTVRQLISMQVRMLCLVGDPAIGKTFFAQHTARALRGEPIRFNGSSEVDLSSLWGRWGLRASETVFLPGPLHTSIVENRVLIIEDFGLIPLETRAGLLGLDQATIENPFSNQVLQIPDDYLLICTSNPETLACRRNSGIATVLWDRFQIVNIPELRRIDWLRMLRQAFPTVSEDVFEQSMDIFSEWREFTSKSNESARKYLTFRSLKRLCQLISEGYSVEDATELAIVNALMPNDSDLAEAARLKLDVSRPAA